MSVHAFPLDGDICMNTDIDMESLEVQERLIECLNEQQNEFSVDWKSEIDPICSFWCMQMLTGNSSDGDQDLEL